MSGIIEISGIAITAAIAALALKNINQSMGRAVAIAGLILTLLFGIKGVGGAITELITDIDISLLGVYGKRMLKALGIGLTVKIASDICTGCGEGGVAGGIETAGKIEIILICLPTVKELFSLVGELSL